MKLNIFSFIFILSIFNINSQNTIAIQSFENSGDTWLPLNFSTPPCTIGTDVWDYTTSLPSFSPSNGFQFWGIRDLDGSCGGTGFETIIFPNINVSSFTDVIFSFDYTAIGFDNNEDLKYELFYDDVSQGEVIVVNGVRGNRDNTNGWKTETVSIPGSVTNVSVILSAKCNDNSDRAGFDFVKLYEAINDNCTDATTLIVGSSNIENVVTGTNVGATSSGELPDPNCANYQGIDVWYTANVPASGLLTVETLDAGSSIDTGIAVYIGSCGNLIQIGCDDNGGTGKYSLINLTGLANTNVYIRVWAKNNSSTGNFNIVAYSPECPYTTTWVNSSWDNGSPNSYTTSIIDSPYDTAVNGSFETCNCQINNNGIVNIAANAYVTIHNDLTVNGTLEVRNEGSLVMINNDAEILIAGVFQVHKATTPLNDLNDYTYWSSPIEGVNISAVFQPGTYNQSRLYF